MKKRKKEEEKDRSGVDEKKRYCLRERERERGRRDSVVEKERKK